MVKLRRKNLESRIYGRRGKWNVTALGRLLSVFLLGSVLLLWPRSDHLPPPAAAPLLFPNAAQEMSSPITLPFGFYHVDYDQALTGDPLPGQLDAITAIAGAGFNTVHLAIYDDLSASERVFSQARELGLKIIADYQSDLPRNIVVERFKDDPTVISWNIGDDVNVGFSPGELQGLDAAVKAIDGDSPTYISMFDPDPAVIDQYVGTADWIGMQSYPISERSLDSTFAEIQAVVHAVQAYGDAPVIANLQAFQWEQTNLLFPTRAPTFEEVRNMTFQAFAAGAEGVLYYTYRDPDWYLPAQQALWTKMPFLIPEVAAIEPWLGTAQHSAISMDKHLIKATWELEDRQLLMVLNTGYDPWPVEFAQVPESRAAPNVMESLLPEQSTNLSLNSDGWVTGTLAPLDVQLYQLQL